MNAAYPAPHGRLGPIGTTVTIDRDAPITADEHAGWTRNTATAADIHALRHQRDRDVEVMHTVPTTPHGAWQQLQTILRTHRDVPDHVATAVLETLGRAVFHICPTTEPCETCHPEPGGEWVDHDGDLMEVAA